MPKKASDEEQVEARAACRREEKTVGSRRLVLERWPIAAGTGTGM